MLKLITKISLLFMVVVGSAQAVIITTAAEGTWDVTTIEGTYNDHATTLMSQVWWQKTNLANEFAATVNSGLGFHSSNKDLRVTEFAPFFAYRVIYSDFFEQNITTSATYTSFAVTQDKDSFDDKVRVYAVASRYNPRTVSEPATLALMGLGLAGLGFSRRRKA